jgi:hypothetical protein
MLSTMERIGVDTGGEISVRWPDRGDNKKANWKYKFSYDSTTSELRPISGGG